MRVVEPNSFKHSKGQRQPKSFPKRVVSIIALILIVSAGTIVFSSRRVDNPQSITETPIGSVVQSDDTVNGELSGLIEFSGNEFRLLFDNLIQPNLTKVNVPPSITGNDVADTRIRQIAETRGYKLRNSPIERLTNVEGYPLQKSAHEPWLALKAKALSEGLNMSIVSAFRSVSDQRVLFLGRLQAEGVSVADVARGTADAEIDKVLATTAVPGYSKHHTGYTIDLACTGYAFENFKNSHCYNWLAANNYEQAKTYGFIPSYPVDADLQGPDPEAWEYVYVGKEVLYH